MPEIGASLINPDAGSHPVTTDPREVAASMAAGDLVVAPGFSCRHQISDFCDGRQALHTAELLVLAETHP